MIGVGDDENNNDDKTEGNKDRPGGGGKKDRMEAGLLFHLRSVSARIAPIWIFR